MISRTPILESLARHLAEKSPQELGQTRIILPNRRAGLFLQRFLAENVQSGSWMPHICSISEFITENSGLELCDPLEALFELYDLYAQKLAAPETLDDFFFRGQSMLRDFDEIDKYLVDAKQLFRNILDLKELEDPFAGIDKEQMNFIRQFWSGFLGGEQSTQKAYFLRNWKLLPILYEELRKSLSARGLGYMGMLFRDLSDRMDDGRFMDSWEGDSLVAGFNALSLSERKIFTWLRDAGAEFYWDHDRSYSWGGSGEAGRFMRENLKEFPASAELDDFQGLNKDKDIRIYELPTDVLQAKTLNQILNSGAEVGWRDCNDTAVVLCDEELLLPVLMSLPESQGSINVTMGYSLKHTPVFGMIEALLRLLRNARKGSGDHVSFYHKDVLALLQHPYFRLLMGDRASQMHKDIIRENLIMVGQNRFQGAFEKQMFHTPEGSRELLAYIRDILHLLLDQQVEASEAGHGDMDQEFIKRSLIHLNKLEVLLNKRPSLSKGLLDSLIRKMLADIRIPFEGEPLSGLQVMGILETRLLDFKHVILLSMNEEIMPAAQSAYSHIPYSLRLAFGLPAREDMDAIYAYYFYRLLQRAEKVDLLYNGGAEGLRSGEMSRYLQQIIYQRQIKVRHPVMEISARETRPIKVQHIPELSQKLKTYLAGENGMILSPSALNTYIDCSLRFYFRYLAGIGESDEIEEDLGPRTFGTVVHDTLHILYMGIAGENEGQMGRAELLSLLDSGQAARVLKEEFIRRHFRGRLKGELEGRNILIYRVMLRYLQQIIKTDMALAPFTLISTEQEYQRTFRLKLKGQDIELRLGGKIDRIDRVGGILRVIDYKTGGAGQRFSSIPALFEPTVNRNSAAFQTLFYAWLAAEQFPGETIIPGLYQMKGIFESDFDPALFISKRQQSEKLNDFSAYEADFLAELERMLQQLFDPGQAFVQRENDHRCSYCDYAAVCSRKPLD